MIRIGVLSASEAVHRDVFAAIRSDGDLALAVRLRSVAELRSTAGIDVLVADLAAVPEIDAMLERLAPLPLVFVDVADPPRLPDHASLGLEGYGYLTGWDAERVVSAARAAAVGLVVTEHPEPPAGDGVLASPGESRVGLTPREREVLALVARGLSNARIAAELGVSPNTVKFHLSGLFSKLGASTRSEAAWHAVQRGVLPL